MSEILDYYYSYDERREPIEIQVSRPPTSTERGSPHELLLWQQFGTIASPVTEQIPNFTLYDAISRAVQCRIVTIDADILGRGTSFHWLLGE